LILKNWSFKSCFENLFSRRHAMQHKYSRQGMMCGQLTALAGAAVLVLSLGTGTAWARGSANWGVFGGHHKNSDRHAGATAPTTSVPTSPSRQSGAQVQRFEAAQTSKVTALGNCVDTLTPAAAQQAFNLGLISNPNGQSVQINCPTPTGPSTTNIPSGSTITSVSSDPSGYLVTFTPPNGPPDASIVAGPFILSTGGGTGGGGTGEIQAGTAQEQLTLTQPRRLLDVGSMPLSDSAQKKLNQNKQQWLQFFDLLSGSHLAQEGEPTDLFGSIFYYWISLQMQESLRHFIATYNPPQSNLALTLLIAKLRGESQTTSTTKIVGKILDYSAKAAAAGYGDQFEELRAALYQQVSDDFSDAMANGKNSHQAWAKTWVTESEAMEADPNYKPNVQSLPYAS
jgi:hypothetical protein